MKFEKTKTLNVLEFFCLHSLMSMIRSKILLHIDTPDAHTETQRETPKDRRRQIEEGNKRIEEGEGVEKAEG